MLFFAIIGNPLIYGVKKGVLVESNSLETAFAIIKASGLILSDTILTHVSSKETAFEIAKAKGIPRDLIDIVSDKIENTFPVIKPAVEAVVPEVSETPVKELLSSKKESKKKEGLDEEENS